MKTNPLLQALFIIGERVIFLVPQVAIFVLISRFLGREVFGQYTLVLTWATLFQTFANFGITEGLAREIGREPERASVYFTHGVLLALGFAATAMAVMVPAVWAMQYPAGIMGALLLASGTLFPAGIIGACRGVVLAHRKVEYMLAVGLVETLVVLPLNSYWIVTGAGLLPIVATIVLAKMLAGCLAFALVHYRVTPVRVRLQAGVFRQLWAVTLPFGIAAQLPAVRVDIFLLSKMVPFETLGLYSAAAKMAEILLVFPLAFYLTMLPRAAADLTEKPVPRTERVTGALAWYFALVIPVGLGVLVLAEPLLEVIYGHAFIPAATLLQVQMGTFLLVSVDVVLMMLCRSTGFQRSDLRLVVITALSGLVLNALLIPPLAAVGAALAVMLSILTGLVLRWRLVAHSIVRLGWGSLIGPPLAVAAALIPVAVAVQGRLPWPAIAVGYVAGYTAIATVSFPFVRRGVRTVLRQRKAATG